MARGAAAGSAGPEDFHSRRAPGGLRIRVDGGMPRSIAGRVTVGLVVLAGLAGFTGSLWGARSMLLRDPRLTISSSDNISMTGNAHVTRAQMLSIFGEDVDTNLMTVPLAARKAELESLPWVEHATVMRLMPNRLKVALVERTPVAFVRQGGRIGLVDAHGVLLDMAPGAGSATGGGVHYSFPVVTGLAADDPLSKRAAQMKLFTEFMSSLDAGPEKFSKNLSEVDLTSPEDLKALIPSNGADILVHFGQQDFLARYQRFEKHLPEWRQQFPKLASVDMRYERDVVLEMQPGAAVPTNDAAGTDESAKPETVAKVPAAKSAAKIANRIAPRPAAKKAAAKPVAAKPPAAKPVAAKHTVAQSEVAFDAPARSHATKPVASAKHTPKGATR